MSTRAVLALLTVLTFGFAEARVSAQATTGKADVIVVVGAPGEEEFGSNFVKWSDQWVKAGGKAGANVTVVGTGPTNGPTDLELLKQALAARSQEETSELWLVLLGHGTFDGKTAKFNLRGPDFTADDLAGWLKPIKRPMALIDCSSASSPFLPKLSARGRVIITATRSGFEQNYARFGQYISEAIADPEADLDKDGQTSLLEAFLTASRRLADFYKGETRLMTEHPLIDDNGDGLGTQADWFKGTRASKMAQGGKEVDGMRAQQFVLVRSVQELKLAPEVRARRDELELSVGKLRDQKAKLGEDEYYKQLEPMLVELAKISTQKQ